MAKLYHYAGPPHIAKQASQTQPARRCIQSAADLLEFSLREMKPKPSGTLIATFIVDAEGYLWLADRHSEHVACARGQPVRAAGEMTIAVDNGRAEIVEITNQSTGYCPEPQSYAFVEQVLSRAGLRSLPGYTREFLFRRCPNCRQINLIKDEIYECALCRTALPLEWNIYI